MSTTITIKNLTKRFGKVVALNNVSLNIEPGLLYDLAWVLRVAERPPCCAVWPVWKTPMTARSILATNWSSPVTKGISVPSGQARPGAGVPELCSCGLI